MSNKTEIKQQILSAVALIPKGSVAPYGLIAKLSGNPGYARYVGYVLKNLPRDTELPWHRVVNSKGKISFPEGSEAYARQRSLLLEEGVSLKNGKISLKTHAWST